MKISPEVVDVIMTSWRKNTLAKYKPILRKWYTFCLENKVNIVHPNLDDAMSFLVQLSRSGYSYSQLCTARSALSSILWVDKGIPFGEYPVIKRLMKGFFECKPTFPRFYSTWDVKIVFDYIRKLPHQDDLPLKILCKKLVVLMALLAGGQRMQTIHKIDLRDITVEPNKIIIPIMDKIKQTKPGKHLKPLEFLQYPNEPKLCVPSNLKAYLSKTINNRTSYPLFISYIKPFKPVSKDTVARWCKDFLQLSGVDIKRYTSHSCRSAASSNLKTKIDVKKILDSAGWSCESTFARFYDKQIETSIGTAMIDT